jgi:monothiol glutaredoxin
MKPNSIRLFIKPGCPWCEEVQDWLETHGVLHETLDVIRDPKARAEMHQLTGQSKAPSIDVDGTILADFGVDELVPWWRQHGFSPQV